ncbi:MAG TPA: DUF2304 domain-containing protein [Conexibacter sp.]|nr:DUF2304 domain-containing protein [Conexibacter sp.]
MALRIQLVAIVVTGGLFVLVFELVRRRRLMERYALLWLFASAVLLLLAVWKGLLEEIAHTIGIYYAPSALFVIAFGFILVLLLHFSLVISRLADQNKVLAQRLGMLQQRLDAHEPASVLTTDETDDDAGIDKRSANRELTRSR